MPTSASCTTSCTAATVIPLYLAPIEAAWSDLVPRTTTVRFDLAELNRLDVQARYDTYKIAVDLGVATADDIARREGLAADRASNALTPTPTPPVDTSIPRGSCGMTNELDSRGAGRPRARAATRRPTTRTVAGWSGCGWCPGASSPRTFRSSAASAGAETFVRGAFDGVDPTRVTIESGQHGGPLVGRGLAAGAARGRRLSRRRHRPDGRWRRPAGAGQAPASWAMSACHSHLAPGPPRADAGTASQNGHGPTFGVSPSSSAVPTLAPSSSTSDRRRSRWSSPSRRSRTSSATVRGIVADAIPAPVVNIPAPDAPSSALLERAGSFAELYQRVMDGDDELLRALADEVTTDVPSIVRPGWLERNHRHPSGRPADRHGLRSRLAPGRRHGRQLAHVRRADR